MVSGGGSSPLDSWDPTVTVASSATLVTGGSPQDWHGRASIKRRPDGVLVLAYKSGTIHYVNDGALHIKFSDDEGATWTAEDTKLGGGAVSGFPLNPSWCGADEDAGEPWLYVALNGDLVLHCWAADYGVSLHGTGQFRSTDGGETWTEEGKVAWGIGGVDDDTVFATDDDFVWDRVTYAGARIYSGGADGTPASMILIKNAAEDLAIGSWEKVSTIMSASEGSGSHGGQEVGLEYLGNNTIIALLRDNDQTDFYRRYSTDLGLTWGTLTNMTSTALGDAGRARVYTFSHLMGLPGWWKDPRLIATNWIHTSPGDSAGRRDCVQLSPDRGQTWSNFYIDTSDEDGGYGDLFYDRTNERFVAVNYRGVYTAADLKQYNLTLGGLG